MPSSAAVYWKNRFQGHTPVTLALSQSNEPIVVKKKYYYTVVQRPSGLGEKKNTLMVDLQLDEAGKKIVQIRQSKLTWSYVPFYSGY